METRPFGNTGLRVSVLGFGGGEIGYLATEQERVGRILNLLLDNGVNVIDTAASYKNSEVSIGNTISRRRDEYVLISKCGQPEDDLKGTPWSEPLILQSVDRSLRRLKTDRLDVLLLHSCDLETLKKGEAIGALAKARDAGKIRVAGYSGDNEAAAYAATLPDVAVVETSLNITDQANIDMVLPKAKERGVGVIIKRPLTTAAFRPRDQHAPMFADYSQVYRERLEQMGIQLKDLGLAAPYDKADPATVWPEIALRFAISFPGAHTAIVGTTNPDNARRNIEAVNKGPLPPSAVERIREAFRAAEKKSGTKWEGQI
jgi:aryl-alcohol dehydrogenase-like predicted oxidoreductase